MGLFKKRALHDRWVDYTEAEINKIKAEKCINCPYKGRFITTANIAGDCCDYLLITGKMRDQLPEHCTHYKDKSVKTLNTFNRHGSLGRF